MKKITLSIVLVIMITTAFIPDGSLVGKQFPEMVCEDYNGKKIILPAEEKDKCTLLGIAFSNDAEKELQLWINPICNKFAPKEDGKKVDPFAVNAGYDINLFFIPKFSFLNKIVSKSSKEKIKADTDKDLYPYLLFYEGNQTLRKDLDVDKKDIPYILLLDKTGKIIYAASGKFDEKKLNKITDAIDKN